MATIIKCAKCNAPMSQSEVDEYIESIADETDFFGNDDELDERTKEKICAACLAKSQTWPAGDDDFNVDVNDDNDDDNWYIEL